MKIKISSIEKLFGKSDSISVKFTETYKKNGFNDNNKGEVYLELDPRDQNMILDFNKIGADTSGGIAAPNLEISAISRLHGPVGGNHETVATGKFNPSDYFSDAEIFGGISLASIFSDTEPLGMNDTPKFQSQSLENGFKNTFNWNTKGPFKKYLAFTPKSNTSLELSSELMTNTPITGLQWEKINLNTR